MTLIAVGHATCGGAGIRSGWVWHVARLLFSGQVLHCQNTPGASSVARPPAWGQGGQHSWEQPWLEGHKSQPVGTTKAPRWMGWGTRGIAWGRLNLWHSLAPLAMDAFDIGLKATALEGEIKGWEKRKDHLFSPLSFFFLNQQRERRHHGNAKLLGRDAQWWRPRANHPSPIAQPSANPAATPSLPLLPHASCTHRWCCPPGWQENPFPRMGSPTASASRCRGGGGREGREEEGDPVNKSKQAKQAAWGCAG